MSSVVISGDSSGTITLAAPAVAGSNTITLPAQTGTSAVLSSAVSAIGQIPFSTDGSTLTPTAKIVSGTAVASTSGTSIDFTSIPSWVKRITVMFNGVSTSGTSNLQLQIGSGSIETTGYSSGAVQLIGSTNVIVAATTGYLLVSSNSAVSTQNGFIALCLLSGNIWTQSGNLYNSALAINSSSGIKTTSGVLDRVRITTVNGTDTFDAGSVNILYE